MKSPYEVEMETIVTGFVIALVIIVVVALIFHRELISCLQDIGITLCLI